MADRPEEGFLPPEPPGPEPELGPRPARQHPPPAQSYPVWQPPLTGPPPGAAGGPPPPGWQGQQQAGWQPPPSWAQPPPGWHQPHQPQQAWGHAYEPDNGSAVTGFVLAMVSLALWLLSAGMSSLLSLGLAIGGVVSSRRGKQKVDRGETRKHRGLAQAGFITSIVMIVLASLSTIAWAVFWIVFATDEDFRNDFDDNDDDGGFSGDGISASLRVGVVLVRLAAALLR